MSKFKKTIPIVTVHSFAFGVSPVLKTKPGVAHFKPKKFSKIETIVQLLTRRRPTGKPELNTQSIVRPFSWLTGKGQATKRSAA